MMMRLATRVFARHGCAVLLFSLGAAAQLPAQAPAQPNAAAQPAATRRPVRVAMAVSGGISKGSYQAGFMLGMVTILRRYEDSTKRQDALVAAAGASAGNINALLSAIEYCRLKPVAVRNTVFASAWIPVGIEKLLLRRELSAGQRNTFGQSAALLSSKALREEVGGSVFSTMSLNGTFRPGCSVPIGITVTRKSPSMLDVGDALRVPNTRYAVIVEARTQPDSSLALVHYQFVNPEIARSVGGIIDVRTTCSETVGNQEYLKAVLASSAFPIAFPPVSLTYTQVRPTPDAQPCARGASETASFIDGGVFDNNPVGLLGALAKVTLSRADSMAELATPSSPLATKVSDALNELGKARAERDLVEQAIQKDLSTTIGPCDTMAVDCNDPAYRIRCNQASDAIVRTSGSCAGVQALREQLAIKTAALNEAVGKLSGSANALADLERARAAAIDSDAAAKFGLRTFFVDPDASRSPTDDEVNGKSVTERGGGPVSELKDLISGFLPSARAYELQLAGRTGQFWFLKSIVPTTRSSRIVGTSLNGFGAFLSRPFREYDFTVGVFDGLKTAVEQLLCDPSVDNAHSCVKAELARALSQVGFLSPNERGAIALLQARESANGIAPDPKSNNQLERIMSALDRRPSGIEQTSGCAGKPLINHAECVAGLGALDMALDSSITESGARTRAVKQLYVHLDALTSQLRFLEERAANGLPQTAFPRLVGVSSELALHSLSTYYRDDPGGYGLSIGPIPCRSKGCHWWLVPQGRLLVGTGGAMEFRKELLYLPTRLPVGIVATTGVQFLPSVGALGARGLPVSGGGLRWLRPSTTFLNEIDFQGQWAKPTDPGCSSRPSYSAGLGASILARLIRLEVRSEGASTHTASCTADATDTVSPSINGRGRVTWFAGFGDVSGALHALYRMMF